MPRPSKGPHLVLEAEHRDGTGKLVRKASWVIRDGGKKKRTGLRSEQVSEAKAQLGQYLLDQHQAPRKGRATKDNTLISDVLVIYSEDKRDIVTFNKMLGRLSRLNPWWGDKVLSDITNKTCMEYVMHRVSQPYRLGVGTKSKRIIKPQTVRRELEDLQAALNHHYELGLCEYPTRVWLPDRPPQTEIWLTRKEAALLLWTAWRMKEMQTRNHDGTLSEEKLETAKRTCRHIARFILMGLYTGSRHDAILAASFTQTPNMGWLDLEHGLYYRNRDGRVETDKKQPVARIPRRLLAHLLRWKRLGIVVRSPVEWNGKPISSVKTGFGRVVKESGLNQKITPHTLRHTCATWLKASGVPDWNVGQFLGMSAATLKRYAKHDPSFQQDIVDLFKPGKV